MLQIGYARVSTREQAVESDALDNQIARIRAAIGPDAPLFVDVMRGEKAERPGFDEMCQALKSGQFKEVVVTRIDRLGRNSQTGFQQIINWWTDKPKIRTVCLQHPVDLDALGGRFNLALMSEAAIFEVDMLSTRVRSTYSGQMEKGEVIARPPLGYKTVGTALVPDQTLHCPLGLKPQDGSVYPGISTAELVKLAFSIFIECASYQRTRDALMPYALTLPLSRKECHDLKRPHSLSHVKCQDTIHCIRPTFPPSTPTLRSWVFNCVYRGHRGHRRNYDPSKRPANGEKVNTYASRGSQDTYEYLHRDVHEALMTEEQYQDILGIEARFKAIGCNHINGKANHGSGGPAGCASKVNLVESLPLTGFLFCDCCGNRLNSVTIQPGNKSRYRDPNPKWHYYRCITANCPNFRLSISPKDVAMQLAWHLCEKAKRVQSGEEQAPAINADSQARIHVLQSTLLKLSEIPDRSLVMDKIQEIERELRNFRDGTKNPNDFLAGTGRELLLSPKATQWNHWAAYLQDQRNMLVKVPQLVRRIDIGYLCEEDRPKAKIKKAGRPKADEVGKPSIIRVEVR